MPDVNQLVLCRDFYKDDVEFWSQVGQAVKLLLNAENILTIRFDEKGLGILSIEFNPDDVILGYAEPHWLTLDEWELVTDFRRDQLQPKFDTED